MHGSRSSVPVRAFLLRASAVFLLSIAPSGLVVGADETPPPIALAYEEALEALHRDKPELAFALVSGGVENGHAPSMFVAGFLQDVGAGAIIEHEKGVKLIEAAAAKGDTISTRYLAWRVFAGWGTGERDASAAAGMIATLAADFEVPRGLSRWMTLKDGMCEPRLSVALYWMMDRAGDEDPIAESNLATVFYGGGWGQRQDMGQHIYWLRRAVRNKEPHAMLLMALYLGLGILGESNPAEETALIRGAAEAGLANAQTMLGGKLLRGDGVEKDLAAASEWYRKAADQGDVEAMNDLADLLRDGGDGLERDYETAFRYSMRAADLGDTEAMADAANMLRQGLGVPADMPGAIALYEKAAAAGYAYAADMLGWIAMNGESGGEPDFERAQSWYEKAAAGGNEHAMRELGRMYEGGTGVEKNLAKAFEWYELAAREGDSWSQNRVGWMLRQGVGIERDDEEAVTWFELAAKNGEPFGHGNLAYHYANGLGVAKDAVVAFHHATMALKEFDDEWAKGMFLFSVNTASPKQRELIKQALNEEIATPGFIESPGALPEAVLELFENGPADIRDAGTAKRVIEGMSAAGREASLVVLARHHYLGAHLPFDLEKARLLVRRAVEAKLPGGEALRATIESIAAESEADRESARVELRRLADSGDRDAARILMSGRPGVGGAAVSPEDVQRYQKIVYGDVADVAGPAIAELLKEFGATIAKEPTNEEFEVMKARVPMRPSRPPTPVHKAAPTFPFELSKLKVEGSAKVLFVVTVDGRTAGVRAIEATHPLFARSAEDAVSRWLFAPAIKDGVPVEVNVEQVLRFNLSTDEAPSGLQAKDPTP